MPTSPSEQPTTNKSIRTAIKQSRQHLSSNVLTRNNKAITQRLIASALLKKAKHVALYMALNGEVDLSGILHWLHHQTDKQVYLPISHNNGTLSFAEVTPTSHYIKNKYGILEPDEHCPRIHASALDVVLTPLVAFNKSKKRLGMGGGYYDRTFAFKQKTQVAPIFIGCAHALQENTDFTSEHWDIDLDYIVTEKTLF